MALVQKPFNENKYVNVGTYNFAIVQDCKCVCNILTNKSILGRDLKKSCECK
jgi:hypothetical protein